MFTSHFLFWSTLCAWFFSCIWSLDINWDHFNLWQGRVHLSLPSQKIKFDKQITWKRQFDLSSIPHCTKTWRQQCTKPKNPQRERLLALGQTIISIHFKPLSPKMLHNVTMSTMSTLHHEKEATLRSSYVALDFLIFSTLRS